MQNTIVNEDIPVYDRSMSVTEYLKQVAMFKYTTTDTDQYQTVLEFLVELTGKNHPHISDFKRINEKIILFDPKKNRRMLRKYGEIYKTKYDIDLNIDNETDSDEIKDKYIFHMLTKMLKKIDYSLIKRQLGTCIIYTVKKNL